MNYLGNYISDALDAAKLTQMDLAKALKKHPTYVSKIIVGRYTPPIRVLNQIAVKLGVPIQECVARIPKTKKGYEVTAASFGLETRYGNIVQEEMELILAWRKLPGDVRRFLKAAIVQS